MNVDDDKFQPNALMRESAGSWDAVTERRPCQDGLQRQELTRMSDCTSIDTLARLFEARLGLLDDEPTTIRLHDGNLVHLERFRPRNRLHLYMLLGAAPPADATSAGLYRRLLSANSFNEGTDGATIGMDEASGELVLSRRFELGGLDGVTLHAAALSMSAIASRWRACIAQASTAGSPRAAMSSD